MLGPSEKVECRSKWSDAGLFHWNRYHVYRCKLCGRFWWNPRGNMVICETCNGYGKRYVTRVKIPGLGFVTTARTLRVSIASSSAFPAISGAVNPLDKPNKHEEHCYQACDQQHHIVVSSKSDGRREERSRQRFIPLTFFVVYRACSFKCDAFMLSGTVRRRNYKAYCPIISWKRRYGSKEQSPRVGHSLE